MEAGTRPEILKETPKVIIPNIIKYPFRSKKEKALGFS
jgi:hypothetical protein